MGVSRSRSLYLPVTLATAEAYRDSTLQCHLDDTREFAGLSEHI